MSQKVYPKAGRGPIPRPSVAEEALTAQDYIAVVAKLLESKVALDGGAKFAEKVQIEVARQLSEHLEAPEFAKLLDNLNGDIRSTGQLEMANSNARPSCPRFDKICDKLLRYGGHTSALDEMLSKNVGKSVFHFLRVKGVEQLKALLNNPHARDASADGVFAAAEVIAAAGEAPFAKEALSTISGDTELLGQTIVQLFKTNSRGVVNVAELLEPKTCDAVLAAATGKDGNNLLHIVLKNC